MSFTRLCQLDALYKGESAPFVLEARELLLVRLYDGTLKAFQGICPHQEISLADALFDGETLMCQAHRWSFNMRTGRGLGPHFCQLDQYALRIEDGIVYVDIACIVSPDA
jgi:toluene monooxygenase system ferredoxin subunit